MPRPYLVGMTLIFAVAAAFGVSAATKTVQLSSPVTGDLFIPDDGKDRHPAAVFLHGSEGYSKSPVRQVARYYADSGIVALSLCYFGCDGRPSSLHNIDVNYVFKAVDYLAGLPSVDPQRIDLVGYSRGAELALLAGSLDPSVHAVVSYYGSPRVVAGWPCKTVLMFTSCGRAWLLNGKPLPIGWPIPVDKIKGPVLLFVGREDRVWPFTYSLDIEAELRAADHPVNLIVFPTAGHAFGMLFWITRTSPPDPAWGGTADGDKNATLVSLIDTTRFLIDSQLDDLITELPRFAPPEHDSEDSSDQPVRISW